MRVLVFGSTGAAGLLFLREALAGLKGATIVLYVRAPSKVPSDIAKNPAVIIVTGQLDDEDGISKAMEGVDIVVSFLGPPASLKDGPFHPSNTPLARGYERIVDKMHAHNVKRLIALGTASITDSNDKFSLKYATMVAGVKTTAYNAWKDVVAIGETIRTKGSDLDWTIVRVPFLTSSDNKEVIAGYIGDGKIGTFLARAGFAAFMYKQVVDRNWIQKAPLITST
ncbi:NAD-P-binding protein [Cylindrobasidium torrendii FP15055 ss-10]|uniref:NAD-P-binding protein n=1 Tax=Cylindrobasidium torrendii FP15055 ss-10 TaxID=1314674 RepID=A0A0D7BBQ0_9AGAR|nr:NAD-P-binding protein [Cylindrobasidium torrendii FP15055 ss-10]